MQQQSDEWYAARLGKVTASRVSDVLAKTKTGVSASRKNYMAQLVAEHLTGLSQGPDLTNNKAVQWGVENEAGARLAYEFVSANTVTESGFIDHPQIELCGASPDGLIDDDGLVEIKCPNTATHIEYLLERQIPRDYRLQMTLQLACTKRQWCDFVSFDPRLDQRNNIVVMRFVPEQSEIKEMESEIELFIAEMLCILDRLKGVAA